MASKEVYSGTPLVNYCEAVLSRLKLGPEVSDKGKGASPSPGNKAVPPEERDNNRLLPKLREVLIIASFGSQFMTGVNAVPKKEGPKALSEERKCENASLVRREISAIIDNMRKASSYRILGVCPDFTGAQHPKSFYLEKIKEHLLACSDSAVVWYTGISERNTGNWCFMDGVVTFQDILELYMCHFRARLLYLVCDCSFSGNWTREMAATLDSFDVPACGHYAKEQGITIKVFTSCRANEEAVEMCFIREGVNVDTTSLWFPQKKLSSGQSPAGKDFTFCNCGKALDEVCQIKHAWKWMDKVADGSNIYWVKGFDNRKPAWHCVLLKEEKRDEFISKTQTEAGKHTLNLLEYGKILLSGWGKDPPDDLVKEIDKQYF